MNIENWIKLLIPIISVIVAIVPASLTYYFTKKNQIEADERKLKEIYYLDYIKAISNLVVTNNSEKARDNMADKQNHLLLIGSAEVVSKLMIFHNYVMPSSIEANGFSANIHDELLTDLIKEMRRDLYKNKRTNDKYPIIHLTGKAPRK